MSATLTQRTQRPQRVAKPVGRGLRPRRSVGSRVPRDRMVGRVAPRPPFRQDLQDCEMRYAKYKPTGIALAHRSLGEGGWLHEGLESSANSAISARGISHAESAEGAEMEVGR